MSVFAGRVDTVYGRCATFEDGEMERWVLATLFATEPRDVYINVLFVTKMERVGDHTEVEFSSGTKISVMELPHRLIGHKPDRPI